MPSRIIMPDLITDIPKEGLQFLTSVPSQVTFFHPHGMSPHLSPHPNPKSPSPGVSLLLYPSSTVPGAFYPTHLTLPGTTGPRDSRELPEGSNVPAVTYCLQPPHPGNTCREPTTFPPSPILFLHQPSGAGILAPEFQRGRLRFGEGNQRVQATQQDSNPSPPGSETRA